MNLIPAGAKPTGNYFCTWDSQCDHMHTWKDCPKNLTSRDAMNEDFLFAENGLLHAFEGVREDIIIVLDDGWDVPYGAKEVGLFGSLEADPERFPSLSHLPPAERLKKLSERIRAMGYRGLGLWIPSQSPYLKDGKEIKRTFEDERLYWDERARWCAEADILYVKVDWGAYSPDPGYRGMMTECIRRFSPGTAVEHAYQGKPLFETNGHEVPEDQRRYLQGVLPVSDYLRTYDVCHELKYGSTVDRVAICLQAAQSCGADAILNIEDTALIGAALGCAIGTMRHDLEKVRKYLPISPRLVSESVCALRWQRIAPPFAAGKGSLALSEERLKDVWHCPKRPKGAFWPDVSEGDYYVTAPAAIARNMPLPKVEADGDKPFVLCSIHPDNEALCVAVTPRTFGEDLYRTPLAAITVKASSPDAPIGLFGRFTSLTAEFEENIEGRRVFAQSLLEDSARDITSMLTLSGNRLTITGDVMLKIAPPEDPEKGIPAVVIKIDS